MANVLEFILKAKDEASKELDGVSGKIESMRKGAMIAGAAMTAFGAGGLKMVSSARELNAQLGQTALTIGVSTEEMRKMALSVTNVTFPLKSVTATFDILSRAGIKNTEDMKASANAFDALADATGSSAEILASTLIPAFKNLGVELPKNSADLDKFTWLTKNTTVDLSEFGSVMSYVAQYGDKLNVSLDDMVAIMAVLESKGKSGATATKIFRTAVTQAASGAVDFNTALGVTQDEIDGFKVKMEGATGITDKYAKVANEQYGVMDKVKQKWEELTLGAGSFLTPLEPVLAGMTALGPAMIFLSSSIGVATVKTVAHTVAMVAHNIALAAVRVAVLSATAAQWLWNVAMSANPIGLLILGIAALIVAIVLIAKNWDTIKEKTIEVWNIIVDFLSGVWDNIVGFFQNNWDKILAILFPAVGLSILVAENWGKITKVVKDIWDKVINIFKIVWENIKTIFIGIGEAIYNPIAAAINGAISLINKLIDLINKIPFVNVPSIPSLPGIPSFQAGGVMPWTGPAYLHAGETVLPAGTLITIPIYLDGDLIAEHVIDIAGGRAAMQRI